MKNYIFVLSSSEIHLIISNKINECVKKLKNNVDEANILFNKYNIDKNIFSKWKKIIDKKSYL